MKVDLKKAWHKGLLDDQKEAITALATQRSAVGADADEIEIKAQDIIAQLYWHEMAHKQASAVAGANIAEINRLEEKNYNGVKAKHKLPEYTEAKALRGEWLAKTEEIKQANTEHSTSTPNGRCQAKAMAMAERYNLPNQAADNLKNLRLSMAQTH